jgi:hypothetical protein
VPPQFQSPYRSELDSKLSAEWQNIWDGKAQPEDVFRQISADVRKTMEQES